MMDDSELLGLQSEWSIFRDMWRDVIWGEHSTLALTAWKFFENKQ